MRALQHRGMAQRLAEHSEDMIMDAAEAEDLADLIQSHILEARKLEAEIERRRLRRALRTTGAPAPALVADNVIAGPWGRP